MPSSFGIRQHLLLTFPELQRVEITVEGHCHLVVHLVIRDGVALPSNLWDEIGRVRGAGTRVEIKEYASSADLPAGAIAPDAIVLSADSAEDADITGNGVLTILQRHWPNAGPRLVNAHGPLVIGVDHDVPESTREDIRGSIHLLLGADVDIRDNPEPAARPMRRAAHAEDAERLEEYAHDAFTGRLPNGALPGLPGSGTLITRTWPGNIFHALSLFETVFVEMPFESQGLEAYGTRLEDFLEAIPLDRIVPVFSDPLTRYNAAMVDAVAEHAWRVVWPGEFRLRQLQAWGDEHWLARRLLDNDGGEGIREAVFVAMQASSPSGQVIQQFYRIERDIALRARRAARRAPSMMSAVHPLSEACNEALRRAFRFEGDRRIEFDCGFLAQLSGAALEAAPFLPDATDVVGGLSPKYVEFAAGVLPGTSGPFKIPSPRLLDGLLLWSADLPLISLREFTHDFKGPAISRMQKIIQHPRSWSDNVDDTLKRYNEEVRAVGGRGSRALVTTVASSLAGLGLSGVGRLVAKALVAALRPTLDRFAPTVLDEVDSWLVGVPRESVSLARVRRKLT